MSVAPRAGKQDRGFVGCGRGGELVDIDDPEPARTPAAEARRRRDGAGLLEDLDAIIGAIADIDQTVIAEDDAMRVTAAGVSKRAPGAAFAGRSSKPCPIGRHTARWR